MTPKILAFAGSTRTDSFNKKLIQVAAKGAQAAGAEVTLIDLRDFPMPLYDGDLEDKEGVPPNGRRLKELMKSHQGLLLSCPEYTAPSPASSRTPSTGLRGRSRGRPRWSASGARRPPS